MKLRGLKVLDLSMFLPGPHLTMMMADHGAHVIKIEPPAGEPVRTVGLRQNGHSVWFRNTHRNKRCVMLDLKSTAGRDALLALADGADVLVEAFRPGVMARLGLGYAGLAARNPRIVYCSISAFGQTGPKRDRPAHDLAIQADSGTLSVNLGMDGQPAMPGVPAADMAGSLMALSGILMALYRRHDSGIGDYLDLSMQDALIAWLPNALGPMLAEQRDPVPKQERSWGGGAFYQIYATLDRAHLVLGGGEHKFVERLLHALGRPDLVVACLQPPGAAQAEARQFLAQRFAQQTLAEWTPFLDALDICWAPVRTLTEALSEPHVAARQMLEADAEGNRHLGLPIRFLHEPGKLVRTLENLGQSTDAARQSAWDLFAQPGDPAA